MNLQEEKSIVYSLSQSYLNTVPFFTEHPVKPGCNGMYFGKCGFTEWFNSLNRALKDLSVNSTKQTCAVK